MLSIRKIGVLGRTYRHLNRYRQILTVFFKYGFGDLIESLKIDQFIDIGLQFLSSHRKERLEKLSRAEKIRLAVEELGPTYIKLGQLLSTRPDLVPMDLLEELAKLQDKVPSFSFLEVKTIIEHELGAAIDEKFEFINQTPIASASIGQVHQAKIIDGDLVAIKVRRPDIRSIIEVDLEIMLHLATLAEKNIAEIAFYSPVKIVEEFARTLEREIDYTLEANNLERFSLNFIHDQTIYIPKIYRDFTTSKVLTTEFIQGTKVSDLAQLEENGLNRKRITARGADICLKQIFYDGFFHADPHPGNIMVLPDDIICLIDFGMVGSVDRQTREDFVDLIDSVVRRNEGRTTQVLLKLTTWDREPNMRTLERDVADFLARHLYQPLKDIQMGRLLQQILVIAARHQLRISPDIFLMMKALTEVEGVGRMLDPEFDIISRAEPFVKKVKMDRFHPGRLSKDIFEVFSDILGLVRQLPKDIRDISRLLRKQKLPIVIELQGLDEILATHDQISNRLSFAIVIAALIIGSALIVISKTPPFFYGISLIGIIGFLAAAVMGVWLLVAIIRKGRL